MKDESKVFMLGFLSLLTLLTAAILVIVFGVDSSSSSKGKSPSPRPGSPGSPIRLGYVPRFYSKQVLQASNPSVTFNFVANPLTDGSAGYLTYNNNSNMRAWPVNLPLNFTHAKISDKIFKFRNPNTSDTYGSFVDGSVPANFFASSIDLGLFF